MNQRTEQQIEELRVRLAEIRIAKKWLQDFRVNAPPTVSAALASYGNFLADQEAKTIAMGKRIKAEAS